MVSSEARIVVYILSQGNRWVLLTSGEEVRAHHLGRVGGNENSEEGQISLRRRRILAKD